MKLRLLTVFLVTLSTLGYAQVFKITQETILRQVHDDVPRLQELESMLLQTKSAHHEAYDSLAPSAYIGRTYEETKEKAQIPFFPIYSPINQYQVGLKTNTKYGIQADLSHSIDTRSGSSSTNEFKNLTTMINKLSLNFDLWKDIFGSTTRARLDSADISLAQAKLKHEIDKNIFSLTLRRIYFSLVANAQKSKVTNELLNLSKKQARDARRRRKNSIADAGEVARYESQVAGRKGSLYYLEFEREQLYKQLRTFLPILKSKQLVLDKYDMNKTIADVLQCTTTINSQKVAPYRFTKYDEMKNLLKRNVKRQEVVDKAHDDIDIKLSTAVKYTGVSSDADGTIYSGSTSGAFEDVEDNDRFGLEAGIMVTIPFGGQVSKTSKVKELYNKKRLQSQINNIDANLEATHIQTTKSINILLKVVEAQSLNSKKLKIRLKDMKKKYSQARIPVSALIQDQDALMTSDLSIVDTQLTIVNTILDYLVVFQQTPCRFNRK